MAILELGVPCMGRLGLIADLLSLCQIKASRTNSGKPDHVQPAVGVLIRQPLRQIIEVIVIGAGLWAYLVRRKENPYRIRDSLISKAYGPTSS